MNRKLFIPALIAIYLVAVPASASDKPLLAIMDIQDKDDLLDAGMTDNLTEYLRGLLASTNRFVVIDRGRHASTLKKLVKTEKKESYRTCYDRSCQVPLGRALAADKILITTVMKIGSKIVLKAEVVDLASEASNGGASVKIELNPKPGRVDRVTEGVDELVRNLIKTPADSVVSGRINAQKREIEKSDLIGEWKLMQDCSSWQPPRKCKRPDGWGQSFLFHKDGHFKQTTWLTASGKSTSMTGTWVLEDRTKVILYFDVAAVPSLSLVAADDRLVIVEEKQDSAMVFQRK